MDRNQVDSLLEQIDHTLDDGNVSSDAMRWTPDPTEPIDLPPRPPSRMRHTIVTLTIDLTVLHEAADKIRRQMERAFAEITRPGTTLGPVILDETDPRTRALWLRQHRNTGPARPRLDGRRAR